MSKKLLFALLAGVIGVASVATARTRAYHRGMRRTHPAAAGPAAGVGRRHARRTAIAEHAVANQDTTANTTG